MLYNVFSTLVFIIILASCQSSESSGDGVVNEEFSSYWFAGNAEVISYNLRQSRYGEMRDGHAVLIFVTEPFSKSAQVKIDDPESAGSDQVTVMKLNMVKKFVTGIYPYSMMLSTFTPVDIQNPPHMLKASMSSQEWCGHVFAQLNRNAASYTLQEFSYFQSEGDNTLELPVLLSEDEIWTLIKLDPENLPVGDFQVLPGLFHTRLMHEPMKSMAARAQLINEGDTASYLLAYSTGREIKWKFSMEFPHMIYGWEETVKDTNGDVLITEAMFKKMLYIPYWQFNSSADIIYRDSLGIR